MTKLVFQRLGVTFFIILYSFKINLYAQVIHPAVSYQRTLTSDYFGVNVDNIIRSNVSVYDTDIVNNVPKLSPEVLRYPGGGVGNWWNWHTGWFMNCPQLPTKYMALPFKANTLENFMPLLDGCHAVPMFVINMVSDSLADQLAMLKHADSIGIPVKYIEMGEELYPGSMPDDTLQQRLYPNAQVYATVANKWIDTLRKHFPAAKFSISAAYNNYGPNAPPALLQWDDTLLKYGTHADAISLHPYENAEDKNADSTQIIEEPKDIAMYLYQPFTMYSLLEQTSAKAQLHNKEIWCTEFNLSDPSRAVHGMWAQGLYIATQTMEMLLDSRITHAITYSMDGTAVHGALFYDTLGFNFGYDGTYLGPPNPPPTVPWAFTCTGNTVSWLGQAFQNQNGASPLTFSPPVSITYLNPSKVYTTYSALCGWLFNSATGSTTVILNLDSVAHNISTAELWPDGGMYQQRSAYALNYIAGPANVTSLGPLKMKKQAPLLLPGFSITYITSGDIPGAAPKKVLIAASDTNICSGSSVTLQAPSGYYKYLWSNGRTSKSIAVDSESEYWVRVWAVANGYYATDSVYIHVNDLPGKPVIASNGSTILCQGQSTNLVLTNRPKNVSYLWNTGATTQQISVSSGGSYYMFDIDAGSGCENVSDTIPIVVNPLPNPVITASGPLTFCNGKSVTLDAGAGYGSYTWSNGNKQESITVNTQGNYSVTVKDGNGCQNTSSQSQVTVWSNPNPTISVNGATTFCDGGSVTLSSKKNYSAYQWMNGSQNISGASKKSYNANTEGTYSMTVTDNNGCAGTSASGVTVTVNDLPPVKINYSGSTNVCKGNKFNLNVKVQSGLTYQWYKDGAVISGATGTSLAVSAAGTYYYVAKNNNQCSAQSNSIVFTSNCRDDESTDNNVLIAAFPNPFSGIAHLNIDLPGSTNSCWLDIRNTLGEIVLHTTLELNEGKTSFEWTPDENIASGVYLVTIRAEDQTYNSKLIFTR